MLLSKLGILAAIFGLASLSFPEPPAQARLVPPGGSPPVNQCLIVGITSAYHKTIPSTFAPGVSTEFNVVVQVNNNCGKAVTTLGTGITVQGVCGAYPESIGSYETVVPSNVPRIEKDGAKILVNRKFEAACITRNNGVPVASNVPPIINVFVDADAHLPDGTSVIGSAGITI